MTGMSGQDKDRGKAHVVETTKKKKKNKYQNIIDITSEETRSWRRLPGVSFRNIDERTGTPIPTTTTTTPPPYPTPFTTIPPTSFPTIPPASFSTIPPTYTTPGYVMPGFDSSHSPGFNTTPFTIRQGLNVPVPPVAPRRYSSAELMQDFMQDTNFLGLLNVIEHQPQQHEQHQHEEPQASAAAASAGSAASASAAPAAPRRGRRRYIEDLHYADGLLKITPTPGS